MISCFVASNKIPEFLNTAIANKEYQNSYEKGIIAEAKAIKKLKSEGYKIIGRRVRNIYGEIDIIAKKDSDVVAFEVKQRKKLSDSLGCISFKQKSRIAKAFLSIISERNDMFENYRIDVICLDSVGNFEHIENAFLIEDFVSC